MAGGRNSRHLSRPKPAPISEDDKKIAETLPLSFDWVLYLITFLF